MTLAAQIDTNDFLPQVYMVTCLIVVITTAIWILQICYDDEGKITAEDVLMTTVLSIITGLMWPLAIPAFAMLLWYDHVKTKREEMENIKQQLRSLNG